MWRRCPHVSRTSIEVEPGSSRHSDTSFTVTIDSRSLDFRTGLETACSRSRLASSHGHHWNDQPLRPSAAQKALTVKPPLNRPPPKPLLGRIPSPSLLPHDGTPWKSRMDFRVILSARARWGSWSAYQRADARPPRGSAAYSGRQAVRRRASPKNLHDLRPRGPNPPRLRAGAAG